LTSCCGACSDAVNARRRDDVSRVLSGP
jgi:hypothetical protein